MMGLLRLRFAAGVCVLAAGLLMGAGGAVAVADPGSSGSAAHGDDASGDQHSTGAKKPKDEPGATTATTGSATTSKTGATTSGTGSATTSGTGATTSSTGATTSATGATTT